MSNGSNVCSKCSVVKPIEEFRIRKDSPSNTRRKECNDCLKLYAKKDYRKNKEKRNAYAKERLKKYPEKVRNEKYKRAYGISLDDYNDLLKGQKNKCKICGTKNPTGTHKHLVVDHCHETNKIRGLLCGRCNAGIGFFNDDLKLIKKAIEYLNENIQD